jgi:uncharacterized protein (DUF1919 family)
MNQPDTPKTPEDELTEILLEFLPVKVVGVEDQDGKTWQKDANKLKRQQLFFKLKAREQRIATAARIDELNRLRRNATIILKTEIYR